MNFHTVCLLVGVMYAVAGYAMVLMRFFGSRGAQTKRFWRWQPPKYAGAWMLAAVGVALLCVGFAEVARGEEVWPPLLIAAGLSASGLASVPALMLAVEGLSGAIAWAGERSTALPPWRFTVGLSLMIFSLGVGAIIPTVYLIMRS